MTARVITRADAKAQGFKRYFTGIPCSNGHTSERFVKYGNCKDCLATRTAKWRHGNRETWKASSKASKSRHQARYSAEQGADYRENPEKYREAWKRYYQNRHDWHCERVKPHGRKRRAQKRGCGGSHTVADTRIILAAQEYRCIYCRADLRKVKRHLDHILPLALGGSNDKSNLQYLCAPCNLAKGAKHPAQFAQERGISL